MSYHLGNWQINWVATIFKILDLDYLICSQTWMSIEWVWDSAQSHWKADFPIDRLRIKNAKDLVGLGMKENR